MPVKAFLFIGLAFLATPIGIAKQLDSKTSADENRILMLENAWNLISR
jgi:hypothetical protein